MRSIERSILIEAPIEAVFTALTSGESIPQFWPIVHADIGARVGAPIVLRGDGFEDRGTITEYDSPRRFAYEYWSTNHGTVESPDTRVTIAYRLTEDRLTEHQSPERRLTNDNDRTIVSVHQQNLPSDELAAQMDQVWNALLNALKDHIERPADDAPIDRPTPTRPR